MLQKIRKRMRPKPLAMHSIGNATIFRSRSGYWNSERYEVINERFNIQHWALCGYVSLSSFGGQVYFQWPIRKYWIFMCNEHKFKKPTIFAIQYSVSLDGMQHFVQFVFATRCTIVIEYFKLEAIINTLQPAYRKTYFLYFYYFSSMRETFFQFVFYAIHNLFRSVFSLGTTVYPMPDARWSMRVWIFNNTFIKCLSCLRSLNAICMK